MITEFESIMREHMNYDDRNTVKAIAEAAKNDQSQILTALTSKLYDLIVAKADKIDYSSISRSKGDITKIENFAQLVQCIDIIKQIALRYKEDPAPIDTVSTAIDNMKKRTPVFKKAFGINSPIIVMLYNNLGMAIVNGVSFMIATCVEYVKDPETESFQMALDTVAYHKADMSLMFQSLKSFNASCESGEFDKAVATALGQSMIKREAAEIAAAPIKPDEPFLPDPSTDDTEEDEDKAVVHDCDDTVEMSEGFASTVAGAASFVTGGLTSGFYLITKWMIPFIRDIVYKWYFWKQTKSDNYAIQANLLEMNAYQLQYNTVLDEKKKEEIFKKQMEKVAYYRKMSNKYNIDNATSSKNAEKLKNQEAVKYATDDIGYNAETDSASRSSLF